MMFVKVLQQANFEFVVNARIELNTIVSDSL